MVAILSGKPQCRKFYQCGKNYIYKMAEGKIVELREQGRIQDFKLGGGALKKIAPSRGRRENFGGISCEKSRFYAKNHIFSILGGAREIFGVFHVKNHDFTPKKSYFFQF
jgi:hypothetical protein